MKISKLCILLFLATFTLSAQNLIKESNTFSLSGNLETMKIAAGGMLLVGTSDGLTAIEAHTDKVAYQYNALGKIKPEEMVVMDNIPYVILTRGYSKVILNYLTGKEIFNSSKGGWTSIYSIKADFSNQKIYILGTTSQGYSFGVFNADTLENEGIVSFTDKKTMGAYVDLTKYYESNGNLFVRTEKGIVCIDKNTFKTKWVYDDLDKMSPYISVLADASKGLFFVYESDGKNPLLHKIDNSGKRTTKKPIKLEAPLKSISFTDQGVFCQMMDAKGSYIQIYNPQTADKVWAEACEIKGSIFSLENTDNGIVYSSNDGLINTIDLKTGKKILKKDIKTGMWFTNLTLLENDNAFYMTSTDMGIANLKSGEFVKEPAKFKKATNMIVSFDEKNDRFVVSTGTELYFIKKDGSATKIMDIKFKEDETPSKIEFRENGILLGAKQNNLMVSYDGKLIYESYYKAPGQSLAAKIALGALTAATIQSGNNATAMGYGKRNDNLAAANGVMGEIGKRFNKTKETKDFLYILTKLDDGIGLVKLNKDNGNKISELLLKDKKPVYEVDDDFGILYFKSDKKEIKSFDLR